jgi:methionyl-tRNA formyltransferase
VIGLIISDSKSFLKIAVKDGYINILELQLAGKKKMSTTEFLRGFTINNEWTAI